ncbi:MAG: 1-acyl-sn-glycerol-3-phosphate acyltransferase [Faecalibacterium sp.]|nr:1-acyl-sn-glycerol-3-phosphate acyltransferase [Ruminococcus sp.]MCM1393016.1 1-acyl-sn-glycerol-3-phosphate acyltransferase [Ruminococcus sp.]MCM1486086.1 1-acyl-sn-glycerol-3-phosphate acyltransferase [Faecalibacterium sp.]
MKFDFSNPKETKFYDLMKPAAKAALKFRFDLNCDGIQNIPEEGGFIIAANHVHFFDAVMIVAYCPRTCHFMAKSDLFSKPVLGSFLKKMNSFPVKRGTSDKNALEFAEKIISNGWILGIFPEGTRSKTFVPQKAKNGVAYLAKKTGADVLPVSIYRTPNKKSLRPKVSLRFGEIIKNETFGFDEEYKSQQIRSAANLIMDKINALWNLGYLA